MTNPPRKTIALLHVHGMGDQWRNEDISDLAAALDDVLVQLQDPPKDGAPPVFRLELNVQTDSTPLAGTREHLTYLETTLPDATGAPGAGDQLRLYEVYWAPLAGDGPAATDVLDFLRAQWSVPFQRHLIPWRRLPQLRRAALRTLVRRNRINSGEAAKLLRLYADFQRDAACARYPRGEIEDFLDFLPAGPLRRDAQMWAGTMRRDALFTFLVTLSIVLFTVVFAVFVLESTIAVINAFKSSGQPFISTWPQRYELNLDHPMDQALRWPLLILTLVTSVGYYAVAQAFLRRFLGDAVFWATYHETSANYAKRRAILDYSQSVFKHILNEGAIDRVIVHAHSLGSVIAHDTLLTLRSQPMPSLAKISHFITFGSPIDKYAYFFEAQQARSRRYEKLVEDVRGDVFNPNRFDPVFSWLNFYEAGDAISGPLDTPGTTGQVVLGPVLPVKNFYTPNALTPTLLKNHADYRHNRIVFAHLWDALVPGLQAGFHRDAQSQFPNQVAPVDERRHHVLQRALQVFLLAIPWSLLLAFLMHGAHIAPTLLNKVPQLTPRLLGLGLAALLLGGFVWGLRRTRWIRPLTPALPVLVPLLLMLAVVLLLARFALDFRQTTGLQAGADQAGFLGFSVPLVLLALVVGLNLPRVHPASRLIRRQSTLAWIGGLVLIIVFLAIVVTTAYSNSQYSWAWWRNVFVWSTVSLMGIALLQFLAAQFFRPSTLFRSTP